MGCSATSTPEWRRGPLGTAVFFFFSPFFLNKSDIGPRTLCNACGLVYAKLVCIISFMARAVIFYSSMLLLLSQIKKRFKEKVINPNKKSPNKGVGGGGVNMNNASTTVAARGGNGGPLGGGGGGGAGGGMYGMAGEESVDELSDDDEYGSQDLRKDMPD